MILLSDLMLAAKNISFAACFKNPRAKIVRKVDTIFLVTDFAVRTAQNVYFDQAMDAG